MSFKYDLAVKADVIAYTTTEPLSSLRYLRKMSDLFVAFSLLLPSLGSLVLVIGIPPWRFMFYANYATRSFVAVDEI